MQGAHVKDIAAVTDISPSKLGTYFCFFWFNLFIQKLFIGRILRVLATNHIFVEVSPDVFTNNRVSSLLDTGRPVKEILAK